MDKPMAGKIKRQEVPFSLMLSDKRLNWVMVKGGEDVRAAFKKFHGYAPGREAVLVICHPETKWDGIGGYSVPRGAWLPVTFK